MLIIDKWVVFDLVIFHPLFLQHVPPVTKKVSGEHGYRAKDTNKFCALIFFSEHSG